MTALSSVVPFGTDPSGESVSLITLSIRYQAVCDADTICSLTNHSYFNLSGHNTDSVLDHTVCVRGRSSAPCDGEFIPYGMLEPVEGTSLNLWKLTRIGAQINHQQLARAGGYGHSFLVDGPSGALRPAARVESAQTGIALQVSTKLPAVHLYTANTIEAGHPGKDDCTYEAYHAFCLETQYFPDTSNQPAFPRPS